jgi:hypothetical protein
MTVSNTLQWRMVNFNTNCSLEFGLEEVLVEPLCGYVQSVIFHLSFDSNLARVYRYPFEVLLSASL